MMTQIQLDSHWRCAPSADDFDGGMNISLLSRFDPRRIDGKMAWLDRFFDLPIQDQCVNYTLKIESVPIGTHLTLNGRDLGEIALPFTLDVTDIVALEDNLIAFRVMRGAAGGFGDVRLIVIPCDS
jgi:hypothetical protein